MGLRPLRAVVAAVVGMATAFAPPVRAQAPAQDAKDAASLDRAKQLFRAGVALMNAQSFEQALDLFLRSRAAYASSRNTINAALCLDKLGRYDEALELYEQVLTRFAAELDPDNRAALGPAMATLRKKVGTLDVSSNVEGSLVVDGRPRGRLPLVTPLPVLAGKHVVRVLKDGYAPFEGQVEGVVGAAASLDARLVPLAAAGLLRVEAPGAEGAEVFVDRAAVGAAPWEGTLGPGPHVVWARRGDLGSAPASIVVVQGQTVTAPLRVALLGPSTRFEVTPKTAELSIDGVALGPGAFEARLPVGDHQAEARELGYHVASQRFSVPSADSAGASVTLALAIDPNHPRWPRSNAGLFWLEAFGGYAVGTSLGGTAEGDCPKACPSNEPAQGFAVGGRAGYRFPFGLSVELGGGYARFAHAFTRRLDADAGIGAPVTYDLADDLVVAGPFALAGLAQRFAAHPRVGLWARVDVGVLFATASDPMAATASAAGATVPAAVLGADAAPHAALVFLAPEIGFDVALGPIHLGAGFAADVFLTDGPTFARSGVDVKLDPACANRPPPSPLPVGCARTVSIVDQERAYGRTVLWMPQLHLGYTFGKRKP